MGHSTGKRLKPATRLYDFALHNQERIARVRYLAMMLTWDRNWLSLLLAN